MPGPTIVCLSANPAMDRRLRMESLAVGEINRAKSAQGLAGGKAAHVAMAARALDAQPVWVGFLGGAIGQECARQLESLGIRVVAIPTQSSTRVNLEIIDACGTRDGNSRTGRGADRARTRRISAAHACRDFARNGKRGAGDFRQFARGTWEPIFMFR